MLDEIETAEDAASRRLDDYFVKPVLAAKVGVLAEQTTKLGVAGILRLMGPVARRVIGGMNTSQLRSVGAHIRHLME